MERRFGSRSTKLTLATLILSTSVVHSGTMGATPPPLETKIYLGVFGGGGALSKLRVSQFGTAFSTDPAGPLAVDAFGTLHSSSSWLVGGHLGYEWPSLFALNASWSLTPAAELEGFYLGGTKLVGDDLNNDTLRLPEHDFRVKYPLKSGVFLVNAVINSNHSEFSRLHPYLGIGLGSAVVSTSKAVALQVSPPEPGINHFNADPKSTTVALALQPKVGLRFNLSSRASIFAEYRFLYLSATNHTFGSTVFPGHVATTSWQVKMKSQYYNFGTAGIQFDL